MPTSSLTMSERRELGAPDEDGNTGLPPYASAPQDPWLAVAGDQPARRPRDSWTSRYSKGDCSALHDHCLEADTWFFVQNQDLEKDNPPRIGASVAVFGPSGTVYAANSSAMWVRDNYTAFHTVPATKANLVPGAIVLGLPRPEVVPESGIDALQEPWVYGVVESVDLDVGVYKLANYQSTMMLAGARVAVLKWVPGGKVEIIGGKQRTQLAVSARDVFLPEK